MINPASLSFEQLEYLKSQYRIDLTLSTGVYVPSRYGAMDAYKMDKSLEILGVTDGKSNLTPKGFNLLCYLSQ